MNNLRDSLNWFFGCAAEIIRHLLLWAVILYGLYSSIVAAGYNLAAQSAYNQVMGWEEEAPQQKRK